MDQQLVNQVVDALGYQWIDEDSKKALTYQVKEGSAFLKNLDPSIDFAKDSWCFGLLVAYVTYTRSNAGDQFRKNYRNDLLVLADRGRSGPDLEDSEDAGA